jgi:hypothetical protein
MKLYVFSVIALILACAGPEKDKDEDTDEADADTDSDADTDADSDADSDADTDAEPFALLRDGNGDVIGTGATASCDRDECVYTMTTTAPAGSFELDITQTGTGEGFPWTENHDGFRLDAENADGSFTYALVLQATNDFEDVQRNESTLFHDEHVLATSTWYFGVTSEVGSDDDCVVTGDDPFYYSEWCSNRE